MKYWPLTTAALMSLQGGDIGNTYEVTRPVVFEECPGPSGLHSSHRGHAGDYALGVRLLGGWVFLVPPQICHLPPAGILLLMLGMTKPQGLEMHFSLALASPNGVPPPCGTKAHFRRPADGRRRRGGRA